MSEPVEHLREELVAIREEIGALRSAGGGAVTLSAESVDNIASAVTSALTAFFGEPGEKVEATLEAGYDHLAEPVEKVGEAVAG